MASKSEGGHRGGKKSSSRMGKGSTKVSPIAVEKFLKGIDFPCMKDDIVNHAQQNDAPDEILDLLEQLPDEEYNSVTEISQQVSEIES